MDIPEDIQSREVNWYRKNGHYADRISETRNGEIYIIGDQSWNFKNPLRKEYIEGRMRQDILLKENSESR